MKPEKISQLTDLTKTLQLISYKLGSISEKDKDYGLATTMFNYTNGTGSNAIRTSAMKIYTDLQIYKQNKKVSRYILQISSAKAREMLESLRVNPNTISFLKRLGFNDIDISSLQEAICESIIKNELGKIHMEDDTKKSLYKIFSPLGLPDKSMINEVLVVLAILRRGNPIRHSLDHIDGLKDSEPQALIDEIRSDIGLRVLERLTFTPEEIRKLIDIVSQISSNRSDETRGD